MTNRKSARLTLLTRSHRLRLNHVPSEDRLTTDNDVNFWAIMPEREISAGWIMQLQYVNGVVVRKYGRR